MSYMVSDRSRKLIRIFEGLKLEAYICPAGVPTIGYGHTGADVYLGMKITEEQAEQFLTKDINKFASLIAPMIRVPLTSDQFGALVCFSYNLGAGSLKTSSLLRKINSNDLKGAGDEFLKWNKARINGSLVELKGLTRRRQAERTLFLSGLK